MIRLSNVYITILFLGAFALMGCKQTLVISEVDYSQPIETVLQPDEEGIVTDVQHGLSFNVLPLQHAETKDTTSVTTDQLRLIRGKEGYYYITSAGYKHVYVMAPERSTLKLKKKILITEEGISEPAFNQRNPYVQLLNRKTGENYALSADGVKQLDENKEKKEATKL